MTLQVQSLALLSGLRIRHCCELWCRCRHGLNPPLLWLWHRPAAIALIWPLAWEPPYATGAAQEMAKRPKKNIMLGDFKSYLNPRENVDIFGWQAVNSVKFRAHIPTNVLWIVLLPVGSSKSVILSESVSPWCTTWWPVWDLNGDLSYSPIHSIWYSV